MIQGNVLVTGTGAVSIIAIVAMDASIVPMAAAGAVVAEGHSRR